MTTMSHLMNLLSLPSAQFVSDKCRTETFTNIQYVVCLWSNVWILTERMSHDECVSYSSWKKRLSELYERTVACQSWSYFTSGFLYATYLSQFLVTLILTCVHPPPPPLCLSDWEVYRKHSILSDLQLPVQDHPGPAVSLHQVSLRPAVPRPDDPSAGACSPAGGVSVCLCVWRGLLWRFLIYGMTVWQYLYV